MENYNELIRRRIKEKFKTIENFSHYVGIPRTTINFILKKGIAYSSYGMVNNILDALDIAMIQDIPVTLDERSLHLLEIYRDLDELGRHSVLAVAETEKRRMKEEAVEQVVTAAYGGISKSLPMNEEEKLIYELVQKIKENNADR